MNRLFVVNKPMFVSSNFYLNRIKKKYKVKKAGFSGTLDPFAKGCLIIAFGQYTKLFQFLKKTPKRYKATLFLGAYSETLDIEKISYVEKIDSFQITKIEKILNSFKGKIKQIPPKYSAKKIDGIRAYSLARDGKNLNIPEIEIEIFNIKLLNYSHPFLSFEVEVSEGTYIRSLGRDIAEKLGTYGSLSYLERLNEGEFKFENERSLNPLDFLNLKENFYLNDIKNLELGRKLNKKDFQIKENGRYFVKFNNYFAIIELLDNEVKYLLNKVELCL